MNGSCPSDDVLEQLLAAKLSAADEAALGDHVASCTDCQQRLEELTRGDWTSPPEVTNSASLLQSEARTGSVLERIAKSDPGAFPPESRTPALEPLDNESQSSTASRAPLPVVTRARSTPAESGLRRSWLSRSAVLQSTGRFFRRQFWTWPIIAALFLGGVGWWVSRSLEHAMHEQRVNELTTVLEADVAALRIWMDNQRASAVLVATEKPLQSLVQHLSDGSNRNTESTKTRPSGEIIAEIRAQLADPLKRAGVTGFILVSPSGRILAADNDAPQGNTLSGYRLKFFEKVAAGEPAVSKPFRSPLLLANAQGDRQPGLPCMYAAAPVRDAAGKPLAALGLRIRPEDQFTRILQVARSGESGETYAFDRNGLMLSQSRFDEELKQIGLLVDRPDSRSILTIEVRDPEVNMAEGERPALRRTEQPLTFMAAEAVQGKSGYDARGYRDYRGVPVVGAWRWLDEYDFGVATEIDVAEAYRPVRILRRIFALLMVLLLCSAVGILLSTLVVARQRRALKKANLAARQLGQYTLVEEIGSGGMGTVYKARHALLRRPTAMKLLNAGTMSSQAVARFEREVQLTSALSHPNTVMIFDYGHTPDGIFYYAMEYLEGINLDELVAQYGPLPEARVVPILRQVCESLAEAHAAGLIHRDVKPANIILTCRGGVYDFVKVVDFGLVKALDSKDQTNITSPNSLAGTPHYLSPEAVNQTDKVDARADVYALGALAYFLLTGTTVFDGDSVLEVCMKHARETPQPPSRRIGSPVNAHLEHLMLRCLSKSPTERPSDAGDLLRQLAECEISVRWTKEDAARWWADHDPAEFNRRESRTEPLAEASVKNT